MVLDCIFKFITTVCSIVVCNTIKWRIYDLLQEVRQFLWNIYTEQNRDKDMNREGYQTIGDNGTRPFSCFRYNVQVSTQFRATQLLPVLVLFLVLVSVNPQIGGPFCQIFRKKIHWKGAPTVPLNRQYDSWISMCAVLCWLCLFAYDLKLSRALLGGRKSTHHCLSVAGSCPGRYIWGNIFSKKRVLCLSRYDD